MDVSNEFIKFQQMKYNLFKSQNPETGLFDVIFEVEGKLLYAHKNMLNLVSETFASMLSDRWAPNKEEPIKIQGYGYDDFYQFITFLYTAQCELTKTNIYAMVDIAEFYGVDLFKEYCDKYSSAISFTVENIFKLMELAEKYSMSQLKSSIKVFIEKNFSSIINSNEFLQIDKQVAKIFLITHKDIAEPEDLFQAVFKWCEKHASDKQDVDDTIKLNDVIKTEISDFIPLFNFRFMKYKFLFETVVPRGYIFPSLNELSKILCDRLSRPLVKITNSHGQALYGNVIPNETAINYIKTVNSSTSLFQTGGIPCYWNTSFLFPSALSSLKKKDGIEWYLIIFTSGQLGVVMKNSMVHEFYYLLAELTAGPSGFQMTNGCKIEID